MNRANENAPQLVTAGEFHYSPGRAPVTMHGLNNRSLEVASEKLEDSRMFRTVKRVGGCFGSAFRIVAGVVIGFVVLSVAFGLYRAATDPPRAPHIAPENKQPATAKSQKPAKPPAEKYWLNTETNVRHNSRCIHYGKSKKGRDCSATSGKACGICGG